MGTIELVTIWGLKNIHTWTPRSLMYSFSFMTSPFGSMYECFSIPKLLPILWCSNLSPFRHILFLGAHGYTLSFSSLWKFSESSVLLILAVFFVSSAYFDATEKCRSSPRSLIMIIKRIGPRTVPCGIPDITLDESDSMPFADTCWYRPVRNSFIQTPTFPVIPSALNLRPH